MNEALTAEDFVIYKENGQIMSGGYSVNSILLNHNRSPIISSNKEQSGGENVSTSIFSDLAVPGGLLFTTPNYKKNSYESTSYNDVDDNLFDNLLKMLDPTSNKQHNRKTKKHRNKHKITKKNHS